MSEAECRLSSDFNCVNAAENEKTVIYALCDPRLERGFEIRYVGKSINLKERLRYHCKDKHRNRRVTWLKSLKKLKLKPEVEILEECYGEEWRTAERSWITYLRFIGCRLTNVEAGGRGVSHISNEAKKRLSIINKGKKMGPFSDIHRARLSASGKNQPGRAAHNRKVWLGRKHTQETCEKISATRKAMFLKKRLQSQLFSSNAKWTQIELSFPA